MSGSYNFDTNITTNTSDENPSAGFVVNTEISNAAQFDSNLISGGRGEDGTPGLTVSVNSVTQVGGDISIDTDDIPEGANKFVSAAQLSDIGSNTSARHSHANKSLLDTYTQTEADLADAVAKKHTIVDISGKADTTTLTAHTSNTSNPHSVTKAQVGLGSVPNTDFTSSIAAKQDTLVSGTNIKTINSTSLLGSGDIVVAAGSDPLKEDVANKSTTTTLGTSDTLYPSQKAVKAYQDNELHKGPTRGTPGWRNKKLSNWYAAMDTAMTTPVDIVVVGDSISGSIFNTNTLSTDRESWSAKLANRLNRRLGITTATSGFLYALGNADAPSMTATSGANNASLSTYGIGGWAVELDNGEYVRQESSMDGITIMYTKYSGGGTMRIRDGGAAGTILADINTSNATTESGHTWTSDALTYASHNIYVENITAATKVVVEACYVHSGTRDKGFRVWQAAHGGWWTSIFTSAPTTYLHQIQRLQPALVISAGGTNDDTANIQSRNETLLTAIQGALSGGDILMWVPPVGNTITAEDVEILRDIADAYDIAYIDANLTTGAINQSGNPAAYDSVHPNEIGRTVIATQIYSMLGGDPVGYLARELAENRYNPTFTGDMTVVGNMSSVGGRFSYGQFFGSPYHQIKNASTDTQPIISIAGSAFNNFAYTKNAVGMWLGAGGSTAPDVNLYRSAADVLKTDDNLIVAAAGTATNSVVNIDATQTLTNKTLISPVLNTGVSGTAIDTDGTLAGNSDTKLASQKAVKTYVDTNNTATNTSYNNTVMTGMGISPATTTQEAVDNFATAIVSALGSYAYDSTVVHDTSNETVGGDKTFTGLTTLSADSGTSTEGGVKIEGTADNIYLHVKGPTSQPLKLTDTRSSSPNLGAGFLAGVNDGAAMASGDRLGYNIFFGNDGSNNQNGTVIAGYASAAWSVGNNPAHLVFSTKDTTTSVERMRMGGGATAGVTINEQGADHDFRVEGDTDQNLLFTDASADRVGIGTTTLTQKLTVNGSIQAAGLFCSDGNSSKKIVTNGNDFVYSTFSSHGFNLFDGSAYNPIMTLKAEGLGIGTASPTKQLDISGNTFRVRTAKTPASASATGAVGEICWDSSYIYVCVATNTWKRTSISTW